MNTTLLVFRREPNSQARNDSVGTYLRLVKEPDAEAKQRGFELAIANLCSGQHDPVVYRYRQADFDVIPGSPWVYWLNRRGRVLFCENRKLSDLGEPRAGMHGGDRYRFARYWWEVGTRHIGRNCGDRDSAFSTGLKWFPYMKGGAAKKWYGNQEWVIAFDPPHYNILSECGNKLPSRQYYFRSGITWTDLSSGGFSARISPGGFIFDATGSTLFTEQLHELLGTINSRFAHFALQLINPTIHVQAGDLRRLPVPSQFSETLHDLVTRAIELRKLDSCEQEITYDFIAPPPWATGIDDVSCRHSELTEIQNQIDEEVYRLYGISNEDRAAIEAELAEPIDNDAGDEENDDSSSDSEDTEAAEEPPVIRDELARQWISYAVGIVMGRFQPGIDGALGRARALFSEDIALKLRALADSDGILVLDQGHPDDLATNAVQALQAMLGVDAAAEAVTEATGRVGNLEEELRRYFERTFFREHIQKYRKRPVYWLLQSPRKMYGVWLFHEKLTKDTLYRIRSDQYVASKIRLLESDIADLRRQRDAAQGREQRRLEKQMVELEEVLDDIRSFAERVDAILQRGYTPHIDDGVLINMAPLWELMPSWQAEPKKCWDALARGDYDWSHQAMDHWPERVRQKCQMNRSYAIAHGLA